MPDPILTEFLATHDADCPVCSYNLRGLTGDACPECSAELRLQVGSPNLHVGPWIVAVVSFALALGFDGVASLLMTIGFTVALIREPLPSIGQLWKPMVLYLTFLTLVAGSATGLLFMVRRRRSWNRLPRRSQRLAAGVVFAGVGVLHAFVGAALLRMLNL